MAHALQSARATGNMHHRAASCLLPLDPMTLCVYRLSSVCLRLQQFPLACCWQAPPECTVHTLGDES
jgi:hypothetical protein